MTYDPEGAPSAAIQKARANSFGRVIHEDSPREGDYMAALAEVDAIRSELSQLRQRLREVADVETYYWRDSTAHDVAGGLTLAIHVLHSLCVGERSFRHKAELSKALWEDIEAHPDKYVLRPKDEKRSR